MSIRVALHHETTYAYDRPVTLGPQVIRLRPAPHCRTPILSYSLRIEPADHFLNWQQDPQGNYLARFVHAKLTQHFKVEVDLVADMTVINPFDFFLEEYAQKFPFTYEPSLAQELAPFLARPEPGPLVRQWVLDSVPHAPLTTNDFLVGLNQRLQREINYMIRMEPGVQDPEFTLSSGSGSCRDTGWLLVQILRNLGLAARFVSGYLIQLRADVKSLDGPSGPEADFTDLHAWAEVYLPGAGWIGLDPTSGLFAGEGHIPLAASPEPTSAAPVTGLVDPCEVSFQHHMSVRRIHETPRVTLPYTEEQWQAIDALGGQIDDDLRQHDVRLTMGGEPTFVSVDDMEGEEWNTAALGEDKHKKGSELLRRIQHRWGAGGFLHIGQGKWYPGESLPRWAMTCYWRTDGLTIWRNPALLADPEHDYGFVDADAERFSDALARRLRIDTDYVIAAYEDPLEYIHKERKLPVNVDPRDNKLENPEDRERMRRAFERGLGRPSGFVLPIQRTWQTDGPAWQSGMWMLRARHLYLIPGDSPVGLRLPLPSLPWVATPQPFYTLDPFEERPELETAKQKTQSVTAAPDIRQNTNQQSLGEETPELGESAEWVVRTAMAVEPRNGRLHVFMPPLRSADDYLELLSAVEDTAEETQLPVIIEGYAPPHDHRLQLIKVTPDPGVIEVNIHPARTWRELVENITGLYEDAHQSRLGTEKFLLDGRHSGTGGGNHIVMGGATAPDSPFLRRPDLLKSLIGFWLNHPSLSYLFSGLFIGPTSQAPRVDETRADAVYELEIAFGLVPEKGHIPPWLVDRIFRNLLVDVTGNTHRAEFCIDKLYSPDSSTGRLGLLELRAFEMPPHARMSLTQQLLIRALVAHFWQRPYREKPILWGTRLHDQFLLPHYVRRDFVAVLAELKTSGYVLDPAWFDAHFEFRFPFHGEVQYDGMRIEVRQAIEPWYVLGEEGAAGGTARYVDSSVERLQVKVSGLIGERYAVTCNGRRLPLQSTGVQNEYVAGVRYRAWQPPRCLHPTIGVHSPLIFDVVDVANGKSIGGCTYHVAHPGGRSYETFPVNANEAQARRVGRFFAIGHTPGPMPAPPAETNSQFPCTLDLRRPPQAD
ncbi:MAG: transglutaminase family protein [Bryobacteraceae bacterium]|nr:transglutaminase family protein [Bryobacteraceae bacterium]